MENKPERIFAFCFKCDSLTPHKSGECIICSAEREEADKILLFWTCAKCEQKGTITLFEGSDPQLIPTLILSAHRHKDVICDAANGARFIAVSPMSPERN